MQAYHLLFSDDGSGTLADIEFEAQDTSEALRIAYRQSTDRRAELWKDGHKLCGIDRASRQEMVLPPRQSWSDGLKSPHFQN